MNQLPTFAPNEGYCELLRTLHKELHREAQLINYDKIKRLRRELIKIEVTLTSEEIIMNTKIAIPDSPTPPKKSKYKL